MIKTKNKFLGKNKFYNFYIGKNESEYFFILPTLGFSKTKNISWDIKMFSIFLSLGRNYIQFNLFEIVKDSNTSIDSKQIKKLEDTLNKMNLYIEDKESFKNFLETNTFIITILKNSNLNHHYVKNIIFQHFVGQKFLLNKD